MPKRTNNNDLVLEDELPTKIPDHFLHNEAVLQQGEILYDISDKQWRLGKAVGIGGFGEIYLASHTLTNEVTNSTKFVAKVEKHTNGPLFVEINCYLRIAREDMIKKWIADHKQKFLGMPHYIASGSHMYGNEKYRFMIMPRFTRDLESVLQQKKTFNLKTVLTISIQIINVLEYIHSHGYVHSDIKASNIMLGNEKKKPRHSSKIELRSTTKLRGRNLRSLGQINYIDDSPYLEDIIGAGDGKKRGKKMRQNKKMSLDVLDEVYLIDYGLASKYILSNGEHREFCRDDRKAHAGTVLFCSRDAHIGVPSRRSDLESLAYNMIYWLTGSLPWMKNIDQPEVVENKKIRCFNDYRNFLNYCFASVCPQFLFDLFHYLYKLQFKDKPDYNYIRCLLDKAITEFGYTHNMQLDFDNLDCGGHKDKQIKRIFGGENKITELIQLSEIIRPPLQSNNIIYKRPKLRKQTKQDSYNSMMNWSKILTDPEVILKQGRERKNTENSEVSVDISDLDIHSLNPTYAMLDIYNKCNRLNELQQEVIPHISGYTPAMMAVVLRRKQSDKVMQTSSSARVTRSQKQKLVNPLEFSRRKRTRNKSQSKDKKSIPSKKIRMGLSNRTYSLRG